jgi:molybdopterin converting factor small subunit
MRSDTRYVLIHVRFMPRLREMGSRSQDIKVDSADDLEDLVRVLVARFPVIRPRLLDEEGKIRKYVSFFVNKEYTRGTHGRKKLKDGDCVYFVFPVPGG